MPISMAVAMPIEGPSDLNAAVAIRDGLKQTLWRVDEATVRLQQAPDAALAVL